LIRNYFNAKDPADAKARYGGVAKLLVIVAVGVGALAELIVCLSARASEGLTSPYELTCVNLATVGTTLQLIPVQYSRARQRPLVASMFQMLEFALIVGIGITLTYVFRRGLRGALETLAITYGTLGIASMLYVRTLGGTLTAPLAKDALRFSLPYVPHFFAVWVQGVAERWALKLAHLEGVLGHYSIASQLTGPVSMLSASWNLERSATMGEIYRDAGLIGLKKHLRRITISYLLVTGLPSILIILAMPLVPIVLGARFTDVIYYIPILLLAINIDATYCPANLVVYYMGQSTRIAMATVISAIVAILASFLFVPFFGVKGALATRLIAVTVRACVMWYGARQCLMTHSRESEPTRS
jgi:O-antigen/teichoic acid export membrane protein